MQQDKKRRRIEMHIKSGCISNFAYRVSMSSSGPTPAADYFVVISFCVEDAHICLLSDALKLDLWAHRREQTWQKLASTMKSKTQGFDQHFHFNNTR